MGLLQKKQKNIYQSYLTGHFIDVYLDNKSVCVMSHSDKVHVVLIPGAKAKLVFWLPG